MSGEGGTHGTTGSYRVTVADITPTVQTSASRQPQVTISAGTTPVTEGTAATFTITASSAPTSALTVNVNVTETEDVTSGTPSSSVTIDADKTTATLTVNTEDDGADESNSVITAEVETGTGYTVGSSSSASVTVEDNDNPPPPPPQDTSPDLLVGSPSVDDNSPDAGGSFTLSATVRNDGSGSSAATTLRYYRSTDATITTSDTQVGTDAVGPLSASGTREESIDLTAPSTADTYYYGACVDAVTGESSATNNCSSSVQVDVTEPPPPSNRESRGGGADRIADAGSGRVRDA